MAFSELIRETRTRCASPVISVDLNGKPDAFSSSRAAEPVKKKKGPSGHEPRIIVVDIITSYTVSGLLFVFLLIWKSFK